ncbi:TIGR03364 family FAD-dependent oxidoreductase [Mycobacterium sp. AMU20-3851]|uniref:TIGR03364 family FAD-dependent oxidoreductase n=1 Tax=Mycobacterium sp. AMU20-3851 TaxID=3122055 RepID=UPI00375446AF
MRKHAYDLVIAGAGIVGLAHAYHACRRGLSVAVVDKAEGVFGASVQNFGHCCITAQSGIAHEYARAGRAHWLDLSRAAQFWSRESGTVAVARAEDEMQVLREFAELRGEESVRLLDRDDVHERTPVADSSVLGGAWFPLDIQLDPRAAAPAIVRFLTSQGVDFYWDTAAVGASTGTLRTSRGVFEAPLVIFALNHDIDLLFPELADEYRLRRCRLHMLRVDPQFGKPLTAPLFTGWSLVRYTGFLECPTSAALRERLATEFPTHVGVDLHQMYTPMPDGTLLVGDTHVRSRTASPFQSEFGFELLIDEAEKLFGVPHLRVLERWQGVYSSAPDHEFLIHQPYPGVQIVTVTTGIGMTTSMGLAASVLERALAPASP